MYIKYKHGISSIKKFISIDIEYVTIDVITDESFATKIKFWYLDAKVNDAQRDGYNIKEYETKEEAEKELENIAKAIEEGKHIYTIK
jgi:hypothetical protein